MIRNGTENEHSDRAIRITRVADNATILSLGDRAHVSIVDGRITPIMGVSIRNLNTGERTEPLVSASAELSPGNHALRERSGLRSQGSIFQAEE